MVMEELQNKCLHKYAYVIYLFLAHTRKRSLTNETSTATHDIERGHAQTGEKSASGEIIVPTFRPKFLKQQNIN
jgi:hypothetical protein